MPKTSPEKLAYIAKWRRENRDKVVAYNSRWNKAHPQKMRGYVKKYYQRNKAKVNEYAKRRWKKASSFVKLVHALRSRINHLLRKRSLTFSLLGCSRAALQAHLANQFRTGMTWNNYGRYWVVDHKIPVASFNLADLGQQRQCFHFTNLQPLEKLENLRKGAKLIYG